MAMSGFDLAGPAEHDGRKSLVDFDPIDVLDRQARLLQGQLGGRGDDAGQELQEVGSSPTATRARTCARGLMTLAWATSRLAISTATAPSEISLELAGRSPDHNGWRNTVARLWRSWPDRSCRECLHRGSR